VDERKRQKQTIDETTLYQRRTTMKTIVMLLSALAIVGGVSAASAAPADPEFGSHAFWQQFSDNG
jgi:hypothetical protein